MRYLISILLLCSPAIFAADLIQVSEFGAPVTEKTFTTCTTDTGVAGIQRVKRKIQHLVFLYSDGTRNNGSESQTLKELSPCTPLFGTGLSWAPRGVPWVIIPMN